jgi:hypothetical protein
MLSPEDALALKRGEGRVVPERPHPMISRPGYFVDLKGRSVAGPFDTKEEAERCARGKSRVLVCFDRSEREAMRGAESSKQQRAREAMRRAESEQGGVRA